MKLSLIVAVAENGGIGIDNKLLWHLPEDLKFFKKTTSGHTIIMGRKSYESIGRPLPNRTNIVITRNANYSANGCIIFHSLDKALNFAKENKETEAFIIGGGELYKQSLLLVDTMYITEVKTKLDADTFFPAFDKNEWKCVSRIPFIKDEKHPFDFEICKYEKL
jgi:dihydrofolate reductase